MTSALLLTLARAAGAADVSWAEWQCSDEVQALVDAGTVHGRDIRAAQEAYREGVREHRIAGGWLIRWTTANEDYDTFGTETVEACGDYHGKPLRRVIMDPHHATYQADRYGSGLHPTWEEDPRVLDAAAKARADEHTRYLAERDAKRAAGLDWLKTATDAELEDFDVVEAHGVGYTDVRAERKRRVDAAEETKRAADWERCLAVIPEGCIIFDPGTEGFRGTYGWISGRPTHVYYNVRIVRGWPDTVENANVIGAAVNGGNAGSVEDVAGFLAQAPGAKDTGGFPLRSMRIVDASEVPPRPVVERIGHEHVLKIRRVEAAGRVVWVGRPTFGEVLVLDEKGRLVRAQKVIKAIFENDKDAGL